ncbi:unnamed protein product [Ectocarpus sp. 4 AP-2014]
MVALSNDPIPVFVCSFASANASSITFVAPSRNVCQLILMVVSRRHCIHSPTRTKHRNSSHSTAKKTFEAARVHFNLRQRVTHMTRATTTVHLPNLFPSRGRPLRVGGPSGWEAPPGGVSGGRDPPNASDYFLGPIPPPAVDVSMYISGRASSSVDLDHRPWPTYICPWTTMHLSTDNFHGHLSRTPFQRPRTSAGTSSDVRGRPWTRPYSKGQIVYMISGLTLFLLSTKGQCEKTPDTSPPTPPGTAISIFHVGIRIGGFVHETKSLTPVCIRQRLYPQQYSVRNCVLRTK